MSDRLESSIEMEPASFTSKRSRFLFRDEGVVDMVRKVCNPSLVHGGRDNDMHVIPQLSDLSGKNAHITYITNLAFNVSTASV